MLCFTLSGKRNTTLIVFQGLFDSDFTTFVFLYGATQGQTARKDGKIRSVWQREQLVVKRNDLNYADSSDSEELPPFSVPLHDVVRVT